MKVNFGFKDLFKYDNRIIGLDLIRCVAVFWVFWLHGEILIPNEFKSVYRNLFFLPIEGVSVFFVLSGFLIGNILIKLFYNSQFNKQDLLSFWSRRWLRTLPNYFFILIILILFKFKDWNYDFSFFYFGQNLISTNTFYKVSWSLSVEEWFYFLFPIILFFLNKKFSKSNSIFIAVFLIIIVPLILRFIFNDNLHRQVVVFRLDSMIYGVLLSYILFNNKVISLKFRKIFLLISLFLMVLYKFYLNYFDDKLINVLIFNIESLIVFFALPYFHTINIFRINFLNKVIVFFSKISYSIYLIHANIVLWWFLRDFENNEYILQCRFEFQRIILYILYVCLTIILSLILTLTIEQPFMRLRNKF